MGVVGLVAGWLACACGSTPAAPTMDGSESTGGTSAAVAEASSDASDEGNEASSGSTGPATTGTTTSGASGSTSTGGGATGGGSTTILEPTTTTGNEPGSSSDGGDASSDDGAPPALPSHVFVAGDSTVANYADTPSPNDQAGWGQMLSLYLPPEVTVDNRARGGRTARWFHMEGGVDAILQALTPGDLVLVQFGTNDGHATATFEIDGVTYMRYADPATDFKTHLRDYFIEPVRAAGGVLVLVTPPPRNSAYCTGGNSLAPYAQAMRELGADEDVPVVDLNTRTVEHLRAICPSPTPEDFFALRADGSVDGTHFQEHGARVLAEFVVEGLVLEGVLPP